MIPAYSSALFISDIHLTPSMPITAQRLIDFCEKEARSVEAVFILGDLFEYWVGDDASLRSPFHLEIKNALANLALNVKIYYQHGNRDFLIGADFLKKTGMTLLPDPTKVNLAGSDYLLSHGDILCTADSAYQLFRKWVRKPWLQQLFLKMPLNWRRNIAQQLRSNSTAQYQRAARYEPEAIQMKVDVTLSACANLVDQFKTYQLIHGHTHLPTRHHENLNAVEWQRWVLSDWDLDHPESVLPKASALRIDANGVRYLDLVKA